MISDLEYKDEDGNSLLVFVGAPKNGPVSIRFAARDARGEPLSLEGYNLPGKLEYTYHQAIGKLISAGAVVHNLRCRRQDPENDPPHYNLQSYLTGFDVAAADLTHTLLPNRTLAQAIVSALRNIGFAPEQTLYLSHDIPGEKRTMHAALRKDANNPNKVECRFSVYAHGSDRPDSPTDKDIALIRKAWEALGRASFKRLAKNLDQEIRLNTDLYSTSPYAKNTLTEAAAALNTLGFQPKNRRR